MPIKFKKILFWTILALAILGIAGLIFYRFTVEKQLEIISPNGGEILQAGKTYQITWKARNIGNIAIVLISGTGENLENVKWIARDIPARRKNYNWQIFVWENPRQDYRISILEYPWYNENKIDYSDNFFTILGPQFASCDTLSIEAEWPFLPSDYPGQKRVFITETSFTGNLEGLEGADRKCQQEAEKIGLKGSWKAFLGDDRALAIERLNLDGIFVEAKSSADLPEGETCHRLLGKNFEEFFKKLSAPLDINQEKFDEKFLENLSEIWLGRINNDSKRECLTVFTERMPINPSRFYSYTTTCQNWTIDREIVLGYPPRLNEEIEFPICHTPEGRRINAVGLGGLSSGLTGERINQYFSYSVGKFCNDQQKLLCIEQELDK